MSRSFSRRGAFVVALGLMAAGLCGPVSADEWPSRTIKLIVPFPPGGAADATARIYAEKLGEALKQTVVIENKPGAGTAIAADAAAKASPDGYTLSLASTGQLTILPHVNKHITFDPFKSFVPITNLASVPYVIAAGPGSKLDKLADVIEAARKEPGKLTYSSCGPGTICHLTGELLESRTDTQLLHVPFKGSAPAVTALLGDQVNLSFDTLTVLAPQIKDGKVKGLAVTSAKRSPQLPDVPTVEEAGIRNFVVDSWFGLVAPAGTPQPIVQRLNAELNKIGNDPQVREKLAAQGLDVTVSTADAFAETIREDHARWGNVIKASAASLIQ